jgi:hypothetical protein
MLPERISAFDPTVASVELQVLAAHTAFHAGRWAAWRRAIGRRHVGMFV